MPHPVLISYSNTLGNGVTGHMWGVEQPSTAPWWGSLVDVNVDRVGKYPGKISWKLAREGPLLRGLDCEQRHTSPLRSHQRILTGFFPPFLCQKYNDCSLPPKSEQGCALF